MPDVVLARLRFGDILRRLFSLGSQLLKPLLCGGKLLLLGSELLNAASHGSEVLRHRFKLLQQLRRCCGGAWRECGLRNSH